MNAIHRATEDVALHAVVHVAGAQVGLADLKGAWLVESHRGFVVQGSLHICMCIYIYIYICKERVCINRNTEYKNKDDNSNNNNK